MITDRFLALDGGSGRSDLWGNGLMFFKENPMFGIGLFNYRAYSEALYGVPAFMHNAFMDALVEGGVVGFTLYIMIFITFFITYYNNRKLINDNGYLLFSLAAMIVIMNTYSLMVNEAFFVLLAVMWRYMHEINVRDTVYQRVEPIVTEKAKK